MPLEELVGLAGSWLSFIEAFALVQLSNFVIIALAVWLPVQFGHHLLLLWRHSLQASAVPAAGSEAVNFCDLVLFL